MPTMTKAKQAERDEALSDLRSVINENDTIYTVLRSVSRSGMQRQIDCYQIRDNQPMFITGMVARLLDYRQAENGALKVNGCGMDMGYHVVDSLSRSLFGEGYKLSHRWL